MATMEELEARLRVLEDERELRSLLARYAFNADLGRPREWTELWTEDGVYDLGPGRAQGATVTPTTVPGRYEGHEELLWKLISGRSHKLIEGRCQHHTLGPIDFQIDGDDALAEGYSLVIVQSTDRTRQVIGGREPALEVNVASANFNRWTFRRVDGRWRISERANRSVGSAEAADVIFRDR